MEYREVRTPLPPPSLPLGGKEGEGKEEVMNGKM